MEICRQSSSSGLEFSPHAIQIYELYGQPQRSKNRSVWHYTEEVSLTVLLRYGLGCDREISEWSGDVVRYRHVWGFLRCG